MAISILIFFYISLKLIFSKNLNDNNLIYRLRKTQDESKLFECILNLINVEEKEDKTKNIVCILEFIRDNPKGARAMIKNVYSLEKLWKQLLETYNIEFMYEFLREINDKYKFIDNLFDVIEIHPEVMNYTLILVNENITNYEFFKAIQNILNIDGMDKVSNIIIYSFHNDAILKLIDTKFLNGTQYAILNETFYSFRTPIFRLIHKILKEGVFTSENELNKNVTIYVLEFIRDNPHIARKIFSFLKLYFNDNKENLFTFLNQKDMAFLYNLTEDLISINNTFLDDLSDVIEKHPELINYTLIIINENITNYEFFKAIQNILNIDGMDKVSGHIINSTYNDAIIKYIGI